MAEKTAGGFLMFQLITLRTSGRKLFSSCMDIRFSGFQTFSQKDTEDEKREMCKPKKI
jgi:hypothetical protein